jgi:hypothetical protein
MHWRRVAPVQNVGAQIVTGRGAVEQVRERLAGKSRLFSELQIDHGDDWIAVFAVPLADESGGADTILPDLGGISLYEEAPGWWLPVGVEAGAPEHARGSLRDALLAVHDVRMPVILVPRFDGDATRSTQAALYAVGKPVPVGTWRAAA